MNLEHQIDGCKLLLERVSDPDNHLELAEISLSPTIVQVFPATFVCPALCGPAPLWGVSSREVQMEGVRDPKNHLELAEISLSPTIVQVWCSSSPRFLVWGAMA